MIDYYKLGAIRYNTNRRIKAQRKVSCYFPDGKAFVHLKVDQHMDQSVTNHIMDSLDITFWQGYSNYGGGV